MANVNRPSGLVPVDNLNGAPYTGKANIYSIPASYSTALYIGDPVTFSGTGTVTTGIPEIKILTAGDSSGGVAYIPCGVIIGLGKYEGLIANPTNLDITYRPASDPAIWYALVVDDPNTLFEVQDIGSSTALTYTDIGNTINLNAGTQTYNYVSAWGLDNNSKGTTATYQMKIIRLARRQNNAVGAYSRWICKFNVHFYAPSSVGV